MPATSNVGPHTQRALELSPIVGDRKVVILTGWAGAGKGKVFDLLLNALSAQLPHVGAIVNEKSHESAIVDASRLSAKAHAKAVAGCACCVSIDQITQQISDFHTAGAKLTIVEQSPLSRTGRIVHRLKAQGFSPLVIAVLNPQQIQGAKSYIYPQIRAAQAVLLTHVGTENPHAAQHIRETQALISDLTKDLPRPPLVLVSSGPLDSKPLAPLWNAVQTLPQLKGPQVAREERVDPADEARRLQDVDNFSEIFVHTYPGISDAEIAEALRTLQTNPVPSPHGPPVASKVTAIRGKGILANEDVDVVVDARGIHVTRAPRHPDAPRFDGQDFLLIRALDPRLFDCWGGIYSALGTQECDPTAVQRVTSQYPSSEQIKRDVAHGQLTVALGADSLLWDLVENLPHISRIPDQGRKLQMGHALTELLRSFLEVRTRLLANLAPYADQHPQTLFDASFITCKVLAHPYLQKILTNPRSPLFDTAQAISALAPENLILKGLAGTPSLAINDRTRITGDDVRWFKLIFERAKQQGRLNSELASQATESIRQKAASAPSPSWRTYLPEIAQALRGG